MSRFQDSSNAFDDVAAEVLGVDRRDLSCMTLLLFAGPASADEVATALNVRRGTAAMALERLELAGYARRQSGEAARTELSGHARTWIERIWAPLWKEGSRVLETYPPAQLVALASFLPKICEIHRAA